MVMTTEIQGIHLKLKALSDRADKSNWSPVIQAAQMMAAFLVMAGAEVDILLDKLKEEWPDQSDSPQS